MLCLGRIHKSNSTWKWWILIETFSTLFFMNHGHFFPTAHECTKNNNSQILLFLHTLWLKLSYIYLWWSNQENIKNLFIYFFTKFNRLMLLENKIKRNIYFWHIYDIWTCMTYFVKGDAAVKITEYKGRWCIAVLFYHDNTRVC